MLVSVMGNFFYVRHNVGVTNLFRLCLVTEIQDYRHPNAVKNENEDFVIYYDQL